MDPEMARNARCAAAMKQLRISISIGSVLAVFGIAGMSKTDISAAINAAPTVNIVRLSNVKGQTWPGDFNGDGLPHLAITGTPDSQGNGVISVLNGDGHGNFSAAGASPVATRGGILGTGDFNKDGRLDLIIAIRTGASSSTLNVLPGLGDGRFDESFLVDQFTNIVFALSADLDGDGNRDLVANDFESDQVKIYRGSGDLQFAPAASLTAGLTPHGGVIADFDGDGRQDLVIANLESRSVSVFLNQGSLNFTAADISLDRAATDATAADVNGDGKLDLIVSGATLHFGLFGE